MHHSFYDNKTPETNSHDLFLLGKPATKNEKSQMFKYIT